VGPEGQGWGGQGQVGHRAVLGPVVGVVGDGAAGGHSDRNVAWGVGHCHCVVPGHDAQPEFVQGVAPQVLVGLHLHEAAVGKGNCTLSSGWRPSG